MSDVGHPPRVSFRDHSHSTIVRGLKVSHLSIEAGHFSMDELGVDIETLEDRFRRIAPWIAAAQSGVAPGRARPRMSTCFLIDDYSVRDTDPAPVIDKLLTAAEGAGVRIDYLARESACARIGEVSVADLVLSMLQAEPEPGVNGSRPPTELAGWLSNGRRSSGSPRQAMSSPTWQPPQEFGARDHSIFLDIELFDTPADAVGSARAAERRWSGPFLTSVWQLLRLGLLRYRGEPCTEPSHRPHGSVWGGSWTKLPAVVQLNPDADAFTAYRTLSIRPQSYLPIEHAVRTILDHVTVEEPVMHQMQEHAAEEGIELPYSIADRVTHVFVEGAPRWW